MEGSQGAMERLTLELEQQSGQGIDTSTNHMWSSGSQTSCNHGDIFFSIGLDGF